ncbi:hypothetical protein T06_4920, partial [Trichinella sp. T6]
LKQYIPKKPKKWGIKVNARTGTSGLLYDFCFYEGKLPRIRKPSGCLTFDIVMKLCEMVPKHRNFKIFFDNYFIHLDLQLRLLKKRHLHHRNDLAKQTAERATEKGERVEKGCSGCLSRLHHCRKQLMHRSMARQCSGELIYHIRLHTACV